MTTGPATETTTAIKRPKGRSPSYPAIPLEDAIRRARQLYDQERQHPVPVETLVRHWNYKSLNGPASLTLAALKKFGLIADEGSGRNRRARVTDLAVDIMVNPSTRKRMLAIQEAALRPAIHREMWEKYRDKLPSDASLAWELTRERGFTETGAKEFIPEYRETVDFAQLGVFPREALQDIGTVGTPETVQDGGEDADGERPARPGGKPRRPVSSEVETYAVPLASGGSVVLEGEFPISEGDWVLLMAVLDAMKPGLVRDRPTQSAPDEGGENA